MVPAKPPCCAHCSLSSAPRVILRSQQVSYTIHYALQSLAVLQVQEARQLNSARKELTAGGLDVSVGNCCLSLRTAWTAFTLSPLYALKPSTSEARSSHIFVRSRKSRKRDRFTLKRGIY